MAEGEEEEEEEEKLKVKLVHASVSPIRGRVYSKRDLRPKVSMVKIAGRAPRKLQRPKMVEASSAAKGEKWAETKMLLL